MCIYTQRLYSCWCRDYYLKPTNLCLPALHTSQPCPQPSSQIPARGFDLEQEPGGPLCPFHLQQRDAALLAEGIPNPGYLGLGQEGSGLRRANTFAGSRGEGVRDREDMRERVRRSEPVRYPSRYKEIEGEREGETKQAQRSTNEVKGRASKGNNYVFEEEDDVDDDEFVLVEDL
jgi:hypothetical protein